jgi:osmotically-inducible protein OsmY
MNRPFNLLVGMALGAGLMYLFDPDRGRRRRALIRDQVVHRANGIEELRQSVTSQGRHLRNRARGAIVETRSRFRREEVDDRVLEARVRAELGRLVPEPAAVSVSAEHGRVTLRGTVPERLMNHLVDGVQNVAGVHDVISRLETKENAG